MPGGSNINAIKQNFRLKQFLGWGVAIIFPLAARGLIDLGYLSLAAVLIYWLFCGLVLRGIIHIRFPFFRVQAAAVKKELIATVLFTFAGAAMYILYFEKRSDNVVEVLLGTLVFVIVNGVLEPLIWANVYDLAGCRIKVSGYLATAVGILLMYTLFWHTYCNFLPVNNPGVILLQIIILGLPVLIYEKTGDITIWSLQHAIYSLVMLYAAGFDISRLMNF
ncbi:MAG: hypothetical protein Q8930_12015 [Bacillota bacterium]|nr:hypothetical protein [Bacillota bacterium]